MGSFHFQRHQVVGVFAGSYLLAKVIELCCLPCTFIVVFEPLVKAFVELCPSSNALISKLFPHAVVELVIKPLPEPLEKPIVVEPGSSPVQPCYFLVATSCVFFAIAFAISLIFSLAISHIKLCCCTIGVGF
ncbi:hypothetical protein SLS59_007928 [Nothophoma quercina]|uniref:Uncharacterized protein n=1 Tax=Nothophoma quercina TaxID=749835 RepID=A0ABR3QVP1_9PLEO